MNIHKIEHLISHAQELESTACHLHQLLSSRIDGLQHKIDLSEDNPIEILYEFVRAYIDHIPDFLDTLRTASHEAGITRLIEPFIEIAEENFLAPVFQQDELTGLDVLLNKAYFTYRLIEEVNESFISHSGTALLPLNMTWANLIIHEVLGDSFANELDTIIEQAVSNIILSQKIYDMEWFTQFISSRDTEKWIDVWNRYKRLSLETSIDFKFTSAY